MAHLTNALRQLRLRPALSITVILMLALGIGATSGIHSLIYQSILAPMDVHEPDDLVNIRSPGLKLGMMRGGLAVGGGSAGLFSYPMFRDLETQQQAFEGVGAHYDFLANLAFGEQTMFDRGVLVSGDYFQLLGIQPALGRLIGPQDQPRVGESLVAVLSHRFWRDRLGADPSVVGSTLTVNGQPLTIVGVAEEGFEGTMRGWDPLVFVPLTLRWLMQPEEPRNDQDRQAYWLHLFARLKPGMPIEQAEADLNGLYRSILRDVEAPMLRGATDQQRQQFLEGRIELEPGSRGQRYVTLNATHPLALLLGATTFVLLIACVNISNLLLARGAAREGEMAIRASIGAGRRRLVAQLLTESVVLAAIGAALALPVALATIRVIRVIAPGLDSDIAVTLQPATLLFAGGTTLVTLLLFGLLPALWTGRADPARVLKMQSAQSVGGRGIVRFRALLVSAQVALSLILLVLAGLFTQSLLNFENIDLGMDVEPVAAFSVTPLLEGASGARLDEIYERIAEELAAQPGVESVATAAIPLFNSIVLGAGIEIIGTDEQPEDDFAQSNPNISPGFFDTLSIPLLAGRDFIDADSLDPNVAIVNEAFVRKFGLERDAVGSLVRLSGAYLPNDPVEIVGVVGDAQYSFVKGDIEPQVFTPRRQFDQTFNSLFYYSRGAVPADAIAGMVRDVVTSVDRALPVGNLTTLRRIVDNSGAADRIMTVLSAAFAALATILAAIGIYGVLAFNVSQRRRELGLRLALGETPGGLRRLVMREVGYIAMIGGAVGLIGAFGAGRLADSMLYGLGALDPLAFSAAVALLGLVVWIAGYVPARRASRIAPIHALRYE